MREKNKEKKKRKERRKPMLGPARFIKKTAYSRKKGRKRDDD